jgi:hypothetical protein
MIRERRVWGSIDDCFDAFLSQERSRGEVRSRSVFFEGDRAWSYGPHYMLARWLNDVLLVNSEKYSVSTSRHTGYLLNAARRHRTAHMVVPTLDNSAWPDLVGRWEKSLRLRAQEYTTNTVKARTLAHAWIGALEGMVTWAKELATLSDDLTGSPELEEAATRLREMPGRILPEGSGELITRKLLMVEAKKQRM